MLFAFYNLCGVFLFLTTIIAIDVISTNLRKSNGMKCRENRKRMKISENKFRVRRATKFGVKDVLFFKKIKNGFKWLYGRKVESLLYQNALLWSYVA